jgi:phosphatidylinositol-3-phosphatase
MVFPFLESRFDPDGLETLQPDLASGNPNESPTPGFNMNHHNALSQASLAISVLALLSLSACGGGTATSAPTAVAPPSPVVSTPATSHDRIIIVVMENQDYASIIGSSAAPYLNALAQQNGLLDNFYANTHPSIGNYFMMTTGQIITNDSAFNSVVTADNLVRRMLADGRTWRVYAESIPSTGYLGGDVNPYVKRHNPFAYFSDVVNSAAQAQNIVGFGQLAADVAGNRLPDLSFVIPNNQSNMHDCPPGMTTCTNAQKIAYGDTWLRDNIDPLLNSAALPANTIVVIAFDEAEVDATNGGGRIVGIFAGPRAKPTFRSSTFYQMQDLLGMFCQGLRLTACPGAGGSARNMAEMLR